MPARPDIGIYKPASAISRMAARTGRVSQPKFYGSSQDGINDMFSRLQQHGGQTQQERMIRDKRRSLDKAVLYSYQGAFVRKVFGTEVATMDGERERPPVRALINPDKVKQDYDDKIISIGYEHEFLPGDVFEWCNTGSYWLIYLQDMTELAYFRAEIRRCRYQIFWLDEEGNQHSTWAAIRGPIETKIDYIQKHQDIIDRPNLSINMLIPYNKDTLKYFQRYSKFYLQEDERKICWRIEGADWISTPSIIQINAVEYFADQEHDDIENGVTNGMIIKPVDQNPDKVNRYIEGESFIIPLMEYTYTYNGPQNGSWSIDETLPIKYNINDDGSITLKWTKIFNGSFELSYGKLSKTIVVQT